VADSSIGQATRLCRWASAIASEAVSILIHESDGTYLGRPRLRICVYVEDKDLNPLPDVLVDAAITLSCAPCERARYTKPSGHARFHWGCNQSGTWTLCVEDLPCEGYVYVPGGNVVTCMDWGR
jgi:hypothetical protein